MKRRKRREQSVVAAEFGNLVPSIIDPSISVEVPIDHRVDVNNVVDDSVQTKIVKWNDNGFGSNETIDDVQLAAEANFGKGGDVVEETMVVEADSIDDFPSRLRMGDIPGVFKAGATMIGGGGADSVVEGGGSFKAARNSERRKVVTVDVSNVHGKAPSHLGDNSKKGIQEGNPKGSMADNSKENDYSKAAQMTGHTNMNFAGIFKENRVEGNGFQLQFYDTMEDDVVLDEKDEIPVEASWGYCLIGCFTGPFPGRIAFNAIVNGWGVS